MRAGRASPGSRIWFLVYRRKLIVEIDGGQQAIRAR
jgi:very-short-patch-repair endonuclease